MTPAFKAGTLPCWEYPIRKRRRLADIDSLSGTYCAPLTTLLSPGDAVPGFPGMIIVDLEPLHTGQSYRYTIQAEGSLDNTLATKLLSRSESRAIGASFETFQERSVSWQTGRKACTGTASTDILDTPAPHGLAAGTRICFLSLTGGTGLTAQSQTTIATVYWLRDVTSTTFKVATTSGGDAVNFTTDITAGWFMGADFFPGTPHPLWPSMYLTECRPSDNLTPWRNVDCSYVGKMWDKPYHRVITVNGMQVNSTEKITLEGIADGDSDLRYRTVELPEVVVNDTYVTTDTIPTGSIPSSHSEGGTPPNPPTIRALTISGSDDETTKQWPNEWSLVGVLHVDTINSGIPLSIYTKSYKYKWPVLLK